MPGTVTHMELNRNPFLGAIRAPLAVLSAISEEGPNPALGAFNAKDSSQKTPARESHTSSAKSESLHTQFLAVHLVLSANISIIVVSMFFSISPI